MAGMNGDEISHALSTYVATGSPYNTAREWVRKFMAEGYDILSVSASPYGWPQDGVIFETNKPDADVKDRVSIVPPKDAQSHNLGLRRATVIKPRRVADKEPQGYAGSVWSFEEALAVTHASYDFPGSPSQGVFLRAWGEKRPHPDRKSGLYTPSKLGKNVVDLRRGVYSRGYMLDESRAVVAATEFAERARSVGRRDVWLFLGPGASTHQNNLRKRLPFAVQTRNNLPPWSFFLTSYSTDGTNRYTYEAWPPKDA